MLKNLRQQLRSAKRRREEAEDPAPPQAPFAERPHQPAPMPPHDEASADALAAIAGRHPALHARLTGLDPWQLRAVLADDEALLVRAQVGSGKTTVLVHKLLWLHLVQGVPLHRMAVLTFTNKAAGEIAQRIADLAPGGPPPASDLWLMGTFHSVARSLLARVLPIETLGYQGGFHVIDTLERDAMWARLIAERGLNIKHARKLARRIEALDEGRLLYGNMKKADDLEQLVDLYREEKLRLGAMDFDDLLHGAQALLARHPLDPAPAWVVIDELQDCSPDQLDLIARLRGEGSRIFAVGDPNQVIYGWRGSSLGVFERFEQRHGARTCTLPVNYRCSGTIVEAARAFLGTSGPVAQAQRADLQALTATRARGAKIDVVRHHDALSEAHYLAARIAAMVAEGTAPEQIAVLTRTRRQLPPMRAVLQAAGLTAVEASTAAAREQPVVRWLCRLLRAGLVAGDDESVRVALTHPDYGVLPESALKPPALRAFREASGLCGLPAISAFLRQPQGRRGARGDLPLALEVVDRLAALPAWLRGETDLEVPADGAPPRTSVPSDPTTLLDWLGVRSLLRPTASHHLRDVDEAEGWLQGVWEEARERGGAFDVALADAISGASLGERRPRGGWQRQAGAVSLMTMHASKGLEFDAVFISGANDGLLPVGGALNDPAGLAEERRLFFVALTRARDRVEIGWHVAPEHARIRSEPSPFLRMLPSNLVRWLDGPEPPASAPPARASVARGAVAADPPPAGAPRSPPTASSGAPPSPESGPPATPGAWRAGEAALHHKYGEGRISRLEPGAVFCTFPGHGEKRFVTAMCPLKRPART